MSENDPWVSGKERQQRAEEFEKRKLLRKLFENFSFSSIDWDVLYISSNVLNVSVDNKVERLNLHNKISSNRRHAQRPQLF